MGDAAFVGVGWADEGYFHFWEVLIYGKILMIVDNFYITMGRGNYPEGIWTSFGAFLLNLIYQVLLTVKMKFRLAFSFIYAIIYKKLV